MHGIAQDLKFQLDMFYEIWTLKESFIKCCGQGLSRSLKLLSIEIDKFKNIKVISNSEYK
ncbi:4'-phosphopantetheinyl transferase superfamily protein [Clostridium beijerinckii]|uniref:4'-phosphopantetheinyl transferase superfamily protein n=1 Tax=Clostridium beijerinckii TaxID=1520 RepID=UPI001F4C4D65|nr:4'-phosphopantetheinyl transferase superfamily protein [Clostridium beijerinckii]